MNGPGSDAARGLVMDPQQTSGFVTAQATSIVGPSVRYTEITMSIPARPAASARLAGIDADAERARFGNRSATSNDGRPIAPSETSLSILPLTARMHSMAADHWSD